jgi:hypothetical protein
VEEKKNKCLHSIKECNRRGKQSFIQSKEEASLKRKKIQNSTHSKGRKSWDKENKTKQSLGIFFKGERSSFWRSINFVHFHTV